MKKGDRLPVMYWRLVSGAVDRMRRAYKIILAVSEVMRKRVIEIIDLVDRAIAQLDGLGPEARRAPARKKAVLGTGVSIILVVVATARLDNAVEAPLFALVAATGLCISIIPSTSKQSGFSAIQKLVFALTATASFMAANSWFNSLNQPIPLWVRAMALALTAIAVISLWQTMNLSDPS